jgi:hypothetical protein
VLRLVLWRLVVPCWKLKMKPGSLLVNCWTEAWTAWPTLSLRCASRLA